MTTAQVVEVVERKQYEELIRFQRQPFGCTNEELAIKELILQLGDFKVQPC